MTKLQALLKIKNINHMYKISGCCAYARNSAMPIRKLLDEELIDYDVKGHCRLTPEGIAFLAVMAKLNPPPEDPIGKLFKEVYGDALANLISQTSILSKFKKDDIW